MIRPRRRERSRHCVGANRKVYLVEPSIVYGRSLVGVITDEMHLHVWDNGIERVVNRPLYVECWTRGNPVIGLPERNSIEHQSAG